MIIPPKDTEVMSVFTCGLCQKRFIRGNTRLLCMVNHLPGSCCHYADRPVNDEALAALEKWRETQI